jgi:hypothetical protein
MDNVYVVTLALVVIVLLYPLGRWWYRRRQAANQADALLSDVLKHKDAFRR